MALVNHLLYHDEAKAREIYEQAMALTDSNPLVLRAYGIFILAHCDAPIEKSRLRALSMIKDAQARDKENLQFRTAYEIAFKYGCYKNPDSAMSYLYLGLAAYFIFDHREFAERAMRRAVVMSSFDERIIQNWKFLRDEFPDKAAMYQPKARSQGMLATLKGGQTKNIHGRWEIERRGADLSFVLCDSCTYCVCCTLLLSNFSFLSAFSAHCPIITLM